MDELINELHTQHKEILLFSESHFLKTNEENIIDKIKIFKKMVSDHLEKEEKLYQVLLNSKVEEIKTTAAQFQESMKKIAIELMSLLEDIEKNNGKIAFYLNQKLEAAESSLKTRIIVEEYTLFPLYEKSLTS